MIEYHRVFSSILEKPGFSGGLIWGHFGEQKVRNLRRNIPSEILGVWVLPCARLSREGPKIISTEKYIY